MTKILRASSIYGRGNPLPVGKTSFFSNFVQRGDGHDHVPGTKVPRLRLVRIGLRSTGAFEDEVNALIEGLRAERDAT
jgi:hypothetical protein